MTRLGWGLAAAILLGAASPAPGAGGVPAPPPSQHAKEELASLDRALARFDALLARDDDARHRAATQATLDEFRRRRQALDAGFDQSKYDDLFADLNLAYHRLAAWMAPPLNPPRAGAGI